MITKFCVLRPPYKQYTSKTGSYSPPWKEMVSLIVDRITPNIIINIHGNQANQQPNQQSNQQQPNQQPNQFVNPNDDPQNHIAPPPSMTATITYKYNYHKRIGISEDKKNKFLEECTEAIRKMTNDHTECIDVGPGSIIITISGPTNQVNSVVTYLNTNPLVLTTYGTYHHNSISSSSSTTITTTPSGHTTITNQNSNSNGSNSNSTQTPKPKRKPKVHDDDSDSDDDDPPPGSSSSKLTYTTMLIGTIIAYL
jgi:hypothetical protein